MIGFCTNCPLVSCRKLRRRSRAIAPTGASHEAFRQVVRPRLALHDRHRGHHRPRRAVRRRLRRRRDRRRRHQRGGGHLRGGAAGVVQQLGGRRQRPRVVAVLRRRADLPGEDLLRVQWRVGGRGVHHEPVPLAHPSHVRCTNQGRLDGARPSRGIKIINEYKLVILISSRTSVNNVFKKPF